MEKERIISYDPKKAWSVIENGNTIFKKVTSVGEVNALIKAGNFLNGKSILINGKEISIHVPTVLEWDDGSKILSMSFCSGENLELLLRSSEHRKMAKLVLQAILRFILENKFYWYDFAPRNVLIDENSISFVDFEKGLDFEVNSIKSFLRNRVYEEYSSFLLKEERSLSCEEVFSLDDGEQNDSLIDVQDIKIKRVKATAIALGYRGMISKEQFLNIYRMFLIAEEPFLKDGQLIFPRVDLEEILESKSTNPNAYNEYALKILELVEKKNKTL